MEGFDYVNITNYSYLLLSVIEDLNLYVLLSIFWLWWLVFELIHPLRLLWVLWWLNLLSIGFFFMLCSWLISYEFLPILQKFSNWFHIAYPYSPFKWLCHPNLGLWFFTSLMIFVLQDECFKMFRGLRSILPMICKTLSFHLTRF